MSLEDLFAAAPRRRGPRVRALFRLQGRCGGARRRRRRLCRLQRRERRLSRRHLRRGRRHRRHGRRRREPHRRGPRRRRRAALVAPCGACRQRIREFAAPDAAIHAAGPEGVRSSFTLDDLLPLSDPTFGPGGGRQIFRARTRPLSAVTLAQEIIRKKRDGGDARRRARSSFFIEGLTAGAVTEGQAAAFAMAVFFRGMTDAERVALTLAMRDSGDVLDWSDLARPGARQAFDRRRRRQCQPDAGADRRRLRRLRADDLGRGLGHTGGTLDKLDAIPGYVSQPDNDAVPQGRARGRLRHHRPDRRPRARRQAPLRHPRRHRRRWNRSRSSPPRSCRRSSPPASQGLVLDVKTGSGAFMPTLEDARALAESLVEVANGAGLPTTRADHRHERAAGHPPPAMRSRWRTPSISSPASGASRASTRSRWRSAAEMLVLGGIAERRRGRLRRDRRRRSRPAAPRSIFAAWSRRSAGPTDFLERPSAHLPTRAGRPARPAGAARLRRRHRRRATSASPWSALGGGRTRARGRDRPCGRLHRPCRHRRARSTPTRPLGIVHARSRGRRRGRGTRRFARPTPLGEAPAGPVALPVLDRIRSRDCD